MSENTKLIKFKTIIGGQKCEIECDRLLCIFDYLETIKKKLDYNKDDELKFTQNGTELLLTTKIESISKTVPIGVLKKHSTQKNNIEKPCEEKYSLSEIHTMLPFFLLYFKLKDPMMFKLFVETNDNGSFANIVLQPKYLELTKILMRQSPDISYARRNQTDKTKLIDCKITIPDPHSLGLLTSHTGIEFNIDKPTYNTNDSQSQLNNILTESDIKKISMLQKYGYGYVTAKENYIKCNKDFNITIEYLKANISQETECEIEEYEV
jgi:hypothetical protein